MAEPIVHADEFLFSWSQVDVPFVHDCDCSIEGLGSMRHGINGISVGDRNVGDRMNVNVDRSTLVVIGGSAEFSTVW